MYTFITTGLLFFFQEMFVRTDKKFHAGEESAVFRLWRRATGGAGTSADPRQGLQGLSCHTFLLKGPEAGVLHPPHVSEDRKAAHV